MTGVGPLNVHEPWALYDSVLIGNIAAITDVDGWLATYIALGALREIPFFNIRNRSSAGEPYCNLDSTEILPFVFHAYSLGVEFHGPVLSQSNDTGSGYISIGDAALFANELPKHAAIQLQVSQDEKLLNTAMLTPAGAGVAGASSELQDSVLAPVGPITTYGIGMRSLANRWRFAEPIKMPRNVTVRAKITFSEYGRNLLNAMAGPGWMVVDPAESPTVHKRAAMIRVSLIGKREVQRRGELHY